jgi:O-antigen/teichoic acid export membrane protein
MADSPQDVTAPPDATAAEVARGDQPSLAAALRARAARGLRFARLRPFDTSTPEGRANERYRRVLLTAAASLGSRGVAILTMLISLPLTLHYLGHDRYGMWMTISSVVGLLGFADLGLGNGLLNAISNADGRGDRDDARRYTTSALLMLSTVALVLGVAFALVYPWVPWGKLFNVKTAQAARESGPAVAAFMACFLCNLPLAVVQRVQVGYQEGLAANLWQCLASLLGFAALLVAIFLHAGLVWLIAAMAGGPCVAYLINSAVVFGVQKPWLRPARSAMHFAAALRLLRMGSMFFILQITCAMAFTADNIIVARVLGSDAVPTYAISARMFAIPSLVVALAINPLWPAYGEALARGDVAWVRRTLYRSLQLTLAIVVPSAVFLVLTGAFIVRVWTHDPNVVPSLGLLLGLGTWLIIGQVANSLATFLNGIHVIRFQAVVCLLAAFVNLWASVVLTRRIGVAGVIWGTNIAYGLLICTPYAFYIPMLVKRIGRQAPAPTQGD